jgi:hypothetical protein
MNYLGILIRRFLIKLQLIRGRYVEVDKRKLEDEVVKYQAAQKIIDSMEPTEAEKRLAEKIEEYLKKYE